MTFTYDDPSSDLGKVRLLIRDVDSTKPLFYDEELQVFIANNTTSDGVNHVIAAAEALESLAANAAVLAVSKKIGDYQYDATKMADALLKTAASLRERDENMPAFGVVEENLSPANAERIIVNQFLRDLE